MSSYYLLFIQPAFVRQYISHASPRITLHHDTQSLQEGDEILPVRLDEKRTVLPFAYRVVSLNRGAGTLVLEQATIYMRAVSLSELGDLAPATGQPDTFLLTQNQFERLSARLGGPRVTERALLDLVERYITARGYYFDQETLYNYHICLKTRPFVILAGISGTGKSKLSQLYAEALGHRTRYLRLPVRPNWNDDRYLLGYFDTITGEYITEPALEFLLDANADEDNLYFFCLDEMNLAHVEYYFSQFLSAMEEERLEDRRLLLMGSAALRRMAALRSERPWVSEQAAQVLIPANLFFTGTINVDETTQPISDKVMDRANTLEFFRVDLEKIPAPVEPPEPVHISAQTWHSYRASVPDTRFRPQVSAISAILNEADLGLGYRVLHEIEMYLANSAGLLAPLDAFDLQVKQRVLPRVRGSEVIGDTIEKLLAYLQDQNLTRSVQRLAEMRKRLTRDGYTTFWR